MVFPRKSKRVLFRSIPMVLPTIGDLMMILSWWISLERESSAFNLFIEIYRMRCALFDSNTDTNH